ncbi:hypothetical protein ACQ858_22155 [Variovorax ureilyticus]|uniref:hypothetical protein n=1 Tax=Variovorax ureilyticus TaxID=1836198 RepID=UPI003D674F13
MFNLIDKSRGYLFSSRDLRQVLDAHVEALRNEVANIDGDQLLNTAPSDLIDYLVEKFTLPELALRRDEWSVSEQETKVDVSRDGNRYFSPGRSGPFYVPGQRIEVYVPFDGESELFYMRASQFSTNPPRARIQGSTLVLEFEQPSDKQSDIRADVDRLLADIEQHIGWGNPQVIAMNTSLRQEAQKVVESRRQQLLVNQNRVAALGIPVRERTGAPKTYAIPDVRKKAAPTLPAASRSPYKAEPVWDMAQYEHALQIIQNMALVMERSPSAFARMDEEALRQHFLVQLNGQFEGRATGETFNFGGKTDILLREGDRNVFIAECKFWKGPKKLAEAVDQLLGYTCWRDTKTAILVFNRGIDTSTVLAGIDSVMRAHDNFKRPLEWKSKHEGALRYVLHQPGDQNRELIVSVMVFHVPTNDDAPPGA